MTSPFERAFAAARRWRPERPAVARIALGAALPAAMLLLPAVTLTLAGDRAAAAETIFLALWAAAVFTALAWLASATRPAHVGLGLATAVLVATLPHAGGVRSVVVGALLALAVVILAVQAAQLRPAPDWRTFAALAFAAAIVLHGHRLFLEGLSTPTLLRLAVLPAVAAALAAGLAAAHRPGAALTAVVALVAAPQLAGEPWWVVLAGATAASTASLGVGVPARLGRRALFCLGGAVLLAGGFPWLRAAPIAALAGALAALPRPVAETPIGERAVVLTQSSPTIEVALSGARVSGLVIDSYLTNGVDLACGRELASLELAETLDGPRASELAQAPWHATLVAGEDSAEWAAGRPDVAARLACPAPPAWISWIPGAGRFLGQTTRARFTLPVARTAHRLRIARHADLPPETAIAIFFVATQR